MSSQSTGKESHFRIIQQFPTNYSPVSISQYVSNRTGMHVVVADRKGPKVNGYFALATEIFDDSGSPHTLEHLVFMGSKNYKYKGLLDKLASRSYSDTNAWTATDHTVYTLDSAGWKGFAQILPIYLEHVILPTLTDEGCYTEVHHVDGEGNDAGVVYSEMQAVQNTGDEIMDLKARRLLYPRDVGFRYETGGLMENLRVLTPERIRSFHKEMYQPKNLCLVLIGEVEQGHLLQILDEFEDGILTDIPSPETPFRRPWIESSQPPPIKETLVETVTFPEADESMGDIITALFGPDCNDPVLVAALDVVLTYLAGSSASILENVMVEKERLASSIGYDWDSRPNTVIWFQSSGVATEKLAFVERRLFELISEVTSKPLNMKYMHECIRRERNQLKFQAESSASFFATAIINDFLFGKRDGSTLKDLSTTEEYDILEKWTEEDWRSFIKRWILDAPHISILGTPSTRMADNIKSNEVARVEARRKELGPENLKKLAEKLKDAIAKNSTEIPTALLQMFPVPDIESIHFIESITARSGLAKKLGTSSSHVQNIIDSETDLPLFIQFEHVPTNFVHLTLMIGTSKLETKHRPLLPLFIDNFFNTPIVKDGQRVEFEEVVTRLEQDTIDYSINGGGTIGYSEGIAIKFQIEPEKYGAVIEWVRTIMFDSIFDENRISTRIAKILAEIPELKRDGYSMANAVDVMIHLDNDSSIKARNTLVKALYMKRLKKLLLKDPKTVISSLETVRKSLFSFGNMRALVIANMEKLQRPVDSWKPFIAKLDINEPLLPLVKICQRFSDDGRNPGNQGVTIVPMSTIDSSFCLSSAKGPSLLTDPILPALKVAISFLETVEGPLWTAIRGNGLAYGANFRCDLDSHIQFSIYRSPDSYRAFQAAKEVIESYIDGKTKIEQYALEGAISSIVAGLADKQATMATAGKYHFINSVVKGVDDDYDTNMLKLVRNIDPDQVRNVMKEVLIPIFTPGKANIVLTCAPIMKDSHVKGFGASGFKTQTRELSSFKESYGLEALDSDDNDDNEDDEEEDGESEDDSSSEIESNPSHGLHILP